MFVICDLYFVLFNLTVLKMTESNKVGWNVKKSKKWVLNHHRKTPIESHEDKVNGDQNNDKKSSML